MAVWEAPEAARSLVIMLAGSMITIAGVTFSITIVALSLTGYVQAIKYEELMELAEARDVVIQVPFRAGDFAHVDTALVRIEPEGRPEEGDADEICRAFLVGGQPTEEQDLEYSVRRLVEVALHALSPGINEPFTAMTCIDWLGAALARLAECGMPASERRDDNGRLRLLLDPLTFEGVTDAALKQTRQAGVGHVAVAIRLLDTLAAIAPRARTRSHAETLRAHTDEVLAGALEAAAMDSDRGRRRCARSGLNAATSAARPCAEIAWGYVAAPARSRVIK